MDKSKQSKNWFSKLILDNRLVTTLLIILLVLLILFMLSKLTWLFKPMQDFFNIVGLPVVLSGVFYYLLNPLVDKLENKFHLKRIWSITIIFVLAIIIIVAGIIALIPIIRDQITTLVQNWPHYWDTVVTKVNDILNDPRLDSLQKQIANIGSDTTQSLTKRLTMIVNSTVNSFGSFIGVITKFLVGIITMPFILFYLLKDGHDLPKFMSKAFPINRRQQFISLITEINNQVSSYIRGQLIVAFGVAVMFWIGFSIIGMKFALTLGIAAGILNLIPYLGSFLAMVPAVIIGFFISPFMLFKVLILFIIEQTIEGRLLSPLVLGNNMSIHPVTILIVLLASGGMFGLMGVIFGIPAYAVLRVLFIHGFGSFKKRVGGY